MRAKQPVTYKDIPKLTKKFVKLVEQGNRFFTVCRLLRIDYETFCRYMELGKNGENEDLINFYRSMLAAESESERRTLEQWQKLNEGTSDYRSLQALLSMRHKWQSPSTKTEITSNISLSVKPDLSQLNPCELLQLELILAKTSQKQIEDGSIIDVEPEDVVSQNTLEIS